MQPISVPRSGISEEFLNKPFGFSGYSAAGQVVLQHNTGCAINPQKGHFSSFFG
jgi:hypothetical protein